MLLQGPRKSNLSELTKRRIEIHLFLLQAVSEDLHFAIGPLHSVQLALEASERRI